MGRGDGKRGFFSLRWDMVAPPPGLLSHVDFPLREPITAASVTAASVTNCTGSEVLSRPVSPLALMAALSGSRLGLTTVAQPP